MKKIIVFFMFFILCSTVTFAHSGRTDGWGGHRDNNNISELGYYHYHHGYSAHLHYNGYCPYTDDLKYFLPSICSECNASVNSLNGTYCLECGNRLFNYISYGVYKLSSFNSESTTRSQYESQISNLKNQLERKETQITSKQNTISSLNKKLSNKEKELQDQQHNLLLIFGFVLLISLPFSYQIGKTKQK